jgi:hypothetical protein
MEGDMNEAVLTQEAKDAMGWLDYPKCLAGERAFPPEDCGSIDGYYRIGSILRDHTMMSMKNMSKGSFR